MIAAGIENILIVTDIVSSIIYAKNLVLEYAAVFQQHLINHRLRSVARLRGTIVYCQNAGEEMMFQLWNKVLENC